MLSDPTVHGPCTDVQIIVQKFLHDSVYTLTTWSSICCTPRPDINNKNLFLTECLILKHIMWSISKIADEETIANLHDKTMDQNPLELRRKYPQLYYPDDGMQQDGGGYDSA